MLCTLLLSSLHQCFIIIEYLRLLAASHLQARKRERARQGGEGMEGEAVLGGGRSWPHETCGTFLADTCGMVIIICSLEHYFADCVDNSKGTLEHSMVDLSGSLQAKRIEGGRSVRSFFLLSSVVVGSLARSLAGAD